MIPTSCCLYLDEETKKLNTELEDQYRQGLEFKMSGGSRRHAGLGFQDQTDDAKSSSEAVLQDDSTSESRDCDSVLPEECSSANTKNREESASEETPNKSLTSGFISGSAS